MSLYKGDVFDILANKLDENSVDCVVTSPPYFNQRDYKVAGQIGLEDAVWKYVNTMLCVTSLIKKVLKPDGVFFLNLGDKYNGSNGHGNIKTEAGTSFENREISTESGRKEGQIFDRDYAKGCLLLIPSQVAIFMIEQQNWILRNDVIWQKSNYVPEPVMNRFTKTYEHVFMFTKTMKYNFNMPDLYEPLAETTKLRRAANFISKPKEGYERTFADINNTNVPYKHPTDIWKIARQSAKFNHFAPFPVALAEKCIKAGCKYDGTVLDPFVGSGTTMVAAKNLNRSAIGIDLKQEYLEIAKMRLDWNHGVDIEWIEA